MQDDGAVLMNLAANARDAMPEGGTLTIETGIEELDMDFLKIHDYGKPGMYAMLTVTDTGHGMDENTAEDIRALLYHKRSRQRHRAWAVNGVWYNQTAQRLYQLLQRTRPRHNIQDIPACYWKSKPKGKKEEHITLSRRTETILLAEDEEEVRKTNEISAWEAGYKVIEAVDGQEAIEKFRENKDSIGLLLLDVIMPKINGKGSLRRGKEDKAWYKALFQAVIPLTSYTNKVFLKRGWTFISKTCFTAWAFEDD